VFVKVSVYLRTRQVEHLTALFSEGRLQDLLTNVRLGRKGLQRTNTIVNCAQKSFIGPGLCRKILNFFSQKKSFEERNGMSFLSVIRRVRLQTLEIKYDYLTIKVS
jgi:hypothetical protein